MTWPITKILSAFLLPPLSFLMIGILGLAVLKSRPALGRKMLALTMALMWLFSMPFTGNALVTLLEKDSDSPVQDWAAAQAIVVLGGGASHTLDRTYHAAMLYRHTGLPILVSGGDPENIGKPEAVMMKNQLETAFGTPVQWIETRSHDTRQNAIYSRNILQQDGITTVLLVTHGWHMPRAKWLFEHYGFKVLSAGTGSRRPYRLTMLDFLPSAIGLEGSRIFFHETIGLLWSKTID